MDSAHQSSNTPQSFRRDFCPSRFVEAASRGSQKDALSIGRSAELLRVNSAPSSRKRKSAKREISAPTPLRRPPACTGPLPKRRRLIPHTNFYEDEIAPQSCAAEFGFAVFAFGPLQRPSSDYSAYSDDVVIEHYRPAPHSYSETNRIGISGPFPSETSYGEHIEAAHNSSSPLHDPAPLPRGREWELKFNRDRNLGESRSPPVGQLRWFRSIAAEPRAITSQLYLPPPDPIRPAAGKVHIAMSKHLMGRTKMWVAMVDSGRCRIPAKWMLTTRTHLPDR